MKCLQLVLASVFLGLSYGSYKLNVLCDDYTTIYYDGVAQKNVAGTDNWNTLASSNIPASTSEVMIKCYNQITYWPNGIKAEILNGDGKVVSETGKSWQCASSMKGPYKPATISSYHTAWKGRAGSGAVIWTSSNKDANAYCKVNIAVDGGYGKWGDWSKCSAACDGGEQERSRKCDSPAPAQGGKPCSGPSTESRKCNTHACPEYTLKVLCDDYTTIYVDGVEKKGVAGTDNWDTLATTKFPANTDTLTIKCYNQITYWPNGIKAEVLDGEGKVVSVTGKEWECANTMKGPYKPATISSYHTAWKGRAGSGAVIWTSSNNDADAFCKIDLAAMKKGL